MVTLNVCIAIIKIGKIYVTYLAKRHQFMMYLHYNKENLIPYNDLIGTKMSEMPVEILDYRQKNLLTNSLNLKDTH